MSRAPQAVEILTEASITAGLNAQGARLLRDGENALYRLPNGVIARISQPGQQQAARREVAISRWLNASGIPAVVAIPDTQQPVDIGERSVTFWEELPEHRQGTPAQVAGALRRLHDLPIPEGVPLQPLDPFVRLAQRIQSAPIAEHHRRWLGAQASTLSEQWAALTPRLTARVVHGDAWAGNVVSTADGRVILLDLERCSIGPPEWDLVSTAVKHTTYGGISRHEYDEFARTYGRDVTDWVHFNLLRDIRELRMTTYIAQQAARDDRLHREATLRIACLRGQHGARPWPWTPAS